MVSFSKGTKFALSSVFDSVNQEEARGSWKLALAEQLVNLPRNLRYINDRGCNCMRHSEPHTQSLDDPTAQCDRGDADESLCMAKRCPCLGTLVVIEVA